MGHPARNLMKICKRLAIGICANAPYIDKPIMFDIIRMEKPEEWSILHAGQHIKSASLNYLVKTAQEQECDWMLFCDADMEFPQDVAIKLLSHGKPIVSGLYHLKHYPFSPVCGWNRQMDKPFGNGVFMPARVNGSGRAWKTHYYSMPKNRLTEVHWTGVGCLLVDMDVFKQIGNTCFYDDWDRSDGTRLRGHDLVFCDTVREAGYNVYVDTSVDCGHRSSHVIDQMYIDAFYGSGMDKAMVEMIAAHGDERTSRSEEKMRYKKVKDAMEDGQSDLYFSPEYWNGKWRRYQEKGWVVNRSQVTDAIYNLIPPDVSVGDVGCGVGVIMSMLKKNGCDVCGYDFSEEAIRWLKDLGMQGEVIDIRTYTPPIPPRHHTVLASHILEHMEDDKACIVALKDMATNQVIVVVPQEDITVKGKLFIEHRRAYTEASLRALLEPIFASVAMEVIHRDGGENMVSNEDIVAQCLIIEDQTETCKPE